MTENMLNFLHDLTYHNDEISWIKLDLFMLHTVVDNGKEFVQGDALNRSHTVLFKIRAKREDVGLWFKYPHMYDANLRNYKLRQVDMNNFPDKSYVDLLTFDDVFNITYDSFDYNDLTRLLNRIDCDPIEIYNNGFKGVYSAELIRSGLIPGAEDVRLRLLGDDLPLRLNYKFGVFDVYVLVAPRLETRGLFYLRV